MTKIEMSRRSALINICAATVVAVVPGAPAEPSEPLIALEANLKELRATDCHSFKRVRSDAPTTLRRRDWRSWRQVARQGER